MNLDGASSVTGRGDIENLTVTTEDTEVEMLPDSIEIRPGVTADIAGEEMSSLDAEESTSGPKILSGYPKADEITSKGAQMLFKTNKPGTIRWALTYADMEELTEEELLKPTTIVRILRSGTLNVKESEAELSVALNGLEPNAEYRLSAILVDDRNNVSRIKEEEFRTADDTVPGFVAGYPITVPIDSDTFDIEAMVTKEGTIYWAVFTEGAKAPTGEV